MKKLLSLMLCVFLCISACVPVFADNGDEVAKLILQVKEKFSISDDVFVFEDYSKEDYAGEVTYYLRWKAKEDDYSHQPYISVRVEADGDIQNYRLGSSGAKEITLPKYTDEQVLKKAGELLKTIAPNRADKVLKGQVEYSYDYNVTFERQENGIPVVGDYISLRLDHETLDVIYYNSNWTNADFPLPENIITYDGAKNIYKADAGYELLYNINTENNEISEIYLSYEAIDSNAYVDAFDGVVKKHYAASYRYSSGGSDMGAMNDKAESQAALSPEEQKLVDEINKMITKEDAEKIVKGIKEFKIRDDAVLSNYSVYKNQYGKFIASLSYYKRNEFDYYSASAAIDVETKKVISFNCSRSPETKSKFSKNNAKEKAESFLEKYYSKYLSETKPEYIIGEAENKYNFTYNRYANDVRVKNNNIFVNIDENSGNISSFSLNWADTDFPSAENVLDAERIYDEALTDNNFRLTYLTSTEYVYDEKSGTDKKTTECLLGYTIKEAPIYSGETGVEIDYRGLPAALKFNGYTDVNGHYCENAANALSKIGIYFEGDKLSPDTAVTQAEYLKLLLRAVYDISYSEDEDALRYAVSQGIITNEEVGAPLTRLHAVKCFINALGFKDAAEIQGIYNCPFTDVADNMKGYASIAGGLGIINNQVAQLRPDSLLSRAELLTMIYNYLIK